MRLNCLSSEPPFPTFKRSVATMNHSIGVVWTPKSLHPGLYRGVIEWGFFYVNNLWLGTDTSLPRAQTWDKRIYFLPPDEPLMYHHHIQSSVSHFEKHKNPAPLEKPGKTRLKTVLKVLLDFQTDSSIALGEKVFPSASQWDRFFPQVVILFSPNKAGIKKYVVSSSLDKKWSRNLEKTGWK